MLLGGGSLSAKQGTPRYRSIRLEADSPEQQHYYCPYISGSKNGSIQQINSSFPSYRLLDSCARPSERENFSAMHTPVVHHYAHDVIKRHMTKTLYRDGTVHISRDMHFITRRETTSGAPKPHRHRSRTFL